MWKSGGDVTYRIKTRLKENRHDWAALEAALTTCAQYFLQAPTPTLHCFFFPPNPRSINPAVALCLLSRCSMFIG